MQHAVGCLGTACPCPCLCICLLRVKFCSGGDGPLRWTAGQRECMHTANLQAHAYICVLHYCCFVAVWGPPVTLASAVNIGVNLHWLEGVHRVGFVGQMRWVCWALFCNICALSLIKRAFICQCFVCTLSEWPEGVSGRSFNCDRLL